MIKFIFSEEKYRLLKTVNLSDLGEHIQFDDRECSIILDEEKIVRKDYFDKPFEMSPLETLLDCISDEIVASGLSEDQEKVLPRGRELYELYDGVYYS